MSLYSSHGNFGTLSQCAHEAFATGRSRLHGNRLHLEVVCEGCGTVLAVHGDQHYEPDPILESPIRPV